jgi:uncharacterized protein (DUF736 family)
MRNIVFDYDQVVFGSSIHALLYAYVNQIPLFYSSFQMPKEIDYLPTSFSFMPTTTLTRNEEPYIVGGNLLEFWQKMSIILSLDGLMPLSNNVVSARIDDDVLKFTTKNSKVIKVKFNHMFLFDENIEGLPQIQQTIKEGIVYDYAKFDNLNQYRQFLIETDEDFVNQVWIDGNKITIVSKTKDIAEDIPDYMIRFRVLDLATAWGYKGKQNGIYHYRKELKIPRFKKLNLKMNTRDIIKTKMHIYAPQSNLTFVQPTDILLDDLLNKFNPTRTWNLLTS